MIPNFAASVPLRVYSSVSPVFVSVAAIGVSMFDAVVTVALPIVSLNSRVVLVPSSKVGALLGVVPAPSSFILRVPAEPMMTRRISVRYWPRSTR